MARCDWCGERQPTLVVQLTPSSNPAWFCDECVAEVREGNYPDVKVLGKGEEV